MRPRHGSVDLARSRGDYEPSQIERAKALEAALARAFGPPADVAELNEGERGALSRPGASSRSGSFDLRTRLARNAVERQTSPIFINRTDIDLLPVVSESDVKAKYEWNERSDVMGEGATARVYRARVLTGPVSASSTSSYAPVELSDLTTIHHAVDGAVDSSDATPPAGTEVAIKVVSAALLDKNTSLLREIRILQQLRHPNVVRLVDVMRTAENLFIVMEMARGPELFDAMLERRSFSELDAAAVTADVLSALAHMHKLGIAHRDLKPENLLFAEPLPEITSPESALLDGAADASSVRLGRILLIDFGFANSQAVRLNSSGGGSGRSSNGLSTPVGTLGYKAPELVRQDAQRDEAPSTDMWALGVIVYTMLCGFPPFFSMAERREDTDFLYNAPFWFFFNDETPELQDQILAGRHDFPEEFWKDVSPEARDFVSSLLKVEVDDRLTAEEALQHPWILRYALERSSSPIKSSCVEAEEGDTKIDDSDHETGSDKLDERDLLRAAVVLKRMRHTRRAALSRRSLRLGESATDVAEALARISRDSPDSWSDVVSGNEAPVVAELASDQAEPTGPRTKEGSNSLSSAVLPTFVRNSGWLDIKTLGRWSRRYFILLDGVLVFTRDELTVQDGEEFTSALGKAATGIIRLNTCTVSIEGEDEIVVRHERDKTIFSSRGMAAMLYFQSSAVVLRVLSHSLRGIWVKRLERSIRSASTARHDDHSPASRVLRSAGRHGHHRRDAVIAESLSTPKKSKSRRLSRRVLSLSSKKHRKNTPQSRFTLTEKYDTVTLVEELRMHGRELLSSGERHQSDDKSKKEKTPSKKDKRTTTKKSKSAVEHDISDCVVSLSRTRILLESPESYRKRLRRLQKMSQKSHKIRDHDPFAEATSFVCIMLDDIYDIVGAHTAVAKQRRSSECRDRERFWKENVISNCGPSDVPQGHEYMFAIVTRASAIYLFSCPTRDSSFNWIMALDRAAGKRQHKERHEHTLFSDTYSNRSVQSRNYSLLPPFERDAVVRWQAFDCFCLVRKGSLRKSQAFHRTATVRAVLTASSSSRFFHQSIEKDSCTAMQEAGWEYDASLGRLRSRSFHDLAFTFDGRDIVVDDGSNMVSLASWDGDALTFKSDSLLASTLGSKFRVASHSFVCYLDHSASRFRVAEFIEGEDADASPRVVSTTLWRWFADSLTLRGPDDNVVWTVQSSRSSSKEGIAGVGDELRAGCHPCLVVFWQLLSQSLIVIGEQSVGAHVDSKNSERHPPSVLQPVSAAVAVAAAKTTVDFAATSRGAMLLAAPQIARASLLKSLLQPADVAIFGTHRDALLDVTSAHVLPVSELNLYDVLGESEVAVTHRAELWGMEVAVKVFDKNKLGVGDIENEDMPSSAAALAFDLKAYVRRHLSLLTFNHPNLCVTFGVAEDEDEVYVAQEYAPKRSLLSLLGLQSNRSRSDSRASELSNDSVDSLGSMDALPTEFLPWPLYIRMMLDASRALWYLHEKRVIHRNVKTGNMLVFDNYTVKLGGFGEARRQALVAEDESGIGLVLASTPGTDVYRCPRELSVCGDEFTAAPQVILSLPYDASCDVYSLGVCIIEVITRRHASLLGRCPQNAFDIEPAASVFPFVPEHCPQDFVDLALRCVKYEPAERPDMRNVVEDLRSLLWKLEFQ